MDKFLIGFFEKMEKRGKVYDQEEKENFERLYEALENKDFVGVLVFGFGMGQGKSTFIQEYCKYKMKTEKNFANAIVNKTVKECIDTCVSLELKEEYKEQNKDLTKEELHRFYTGQIIDGRYAKNPNLECFNAITVSGFNSKYCPLYSQLTRDVPSESEVEMIRQEFGEESVPQEWRKLPDNSLCLHCYRNDCIKKISAKIAEEHKTVLLSHNRLFNSNDTGAMLKDVLHYKNEKGEPIKRKTLIIDEKLTMADIENVKMKSILKLKKAIIKAKGNQEEIDMIQKIIDILESFQKPTDSRDMITQEITNILPSLILTDTTKTKLLKRSKEIRETLQLLEMLNKYEICIISQVYMARKEEKEKREFTFARYVDLMEYIKYFEKIIVMDATVELDLEYKKSKVQLNNEIKNKKRKINLFEPVNPCNLSKSSIQYDIQHKESELVKKMARECDEIIEKTGENTLIVTYKSVFKNDDFKERLKEHITSDKDKYKIIHFRAIYNRCELFIRI